MAATCGRYFAAAEVGGLLFQERMQYVYLSHCVNVTTLLNNVSVCVWMNDLLSVHMYEYVYQSGCVWGS